MSTSIYDYSTVTSPSEALDWFNNSIRKAAEYNVFGNKTVFEAVVLSDAYPLSVLESGAPGFPTPAGGETGPTWGLNTRFAFPARIVGMPTPHAFLPNPCDPRYEDEAESSSLSTWLIDAHTTFISQVGYSTDPKKRPKIGDIVEVRLKPGPNGYDLQFGNFIKILDSYRVGADTTDPKACVSMENLFRISPDSSALLRTGGKPNPDPGEAPGPNLEFTWDELEILRVPLQPLLNYIAAREGNYDSVNRGSSGDTPDVSQVIAGVTGLKTMTIAQVQAYQKDGSKAGDVDMSTLPGRPAPSNTPGLLAVGKYQFIPRTLRSIVSDTGIPSSTLFNENTQERLGVGLMVYKRRTLGKYLLGMYDSLEYAAQNLAREWSSQPIVWPENNCQRGQSRYCDEGDNMAHYTPEQSTTALSQARAMVAGNAAAQQLLRRKGYIGDGS